MEKKSQKIKELTENNDELENYFSNTIIPQLFIDAQLVLRKFTPPAMKQFSLKLSDVGRNISEVKDNIRFPSIVDNIQQVIDSGELLEKEIQTTDMRWYQMNILPYIISKTRESNGVIITFVEITMRIRDLKEQETLITEHEILLDTISHDIKTPLTSLGLTLEMLKKIPEQGMDKFPMLIEKVENSLVKMKDIINDLTESRKSQHHNEKEEELLDVAQVLEDVRLTLSEQIHSSGAIIKTEIEVSEVLFVRRKLRSVLYNLLSNAIKYKAADRVPEILVKVNENKGQTVISMADNGLGIAKEDYDKIFSKYERLTKSVEGAGIGLYLVKEIIELSGGKINVKSELGVGTTFKITIKNQKS